MSVLLLSLITHLFVYFAVDGVVLNLVKLASFAQGFLSAIGTTALVSD
jgi:hypothetical protein